MGVESVVYRCLHRLLRQYTHNKLPITGWCNETFQVVGLDPHKALKSSFRTNRIDLELGATALEDAGFLLYELRPTDTWLFADDEDEPGTNDSIQRAKRTLDELASSIRGSAPTLFPDTAGVSVADLNPAVAAQCLDSLRSGVLEQLKLKTDAIEWVYDGLSPLHLPDVISKQKGAPLTVGIILCSLASRLQMPVSLVSTAPPRRSPVTGPLMLQELPPEVVSRHAGRTLAAAPAPDSWLLRLEPAGKLLLDLGTRGMPLITAAECSARYPHADVSAPCGPELVLKVWAELARTAVLAHQRRGESDDVAHWLYQLLALDAAAPEWQHMLAEQPLQ